MRDFILLIFVLKWLVINSECENGCSGHGRCTIFDMCVCHRNWIGNDCNNRVCQFGPSFVDIPVGDLNGNGEVDGPSDTVIINSEEYPYGTTEAFPNMINTDLQILSNTAHQYTECSSAGVCNRQTGECDCYPGFEGVSCQRTTCPTGNHSHPLSYEDPIPCSGHGVCQSLRQLARQDSETIYQLWDKNTLRGCACDPGFYGADCSLRYCPKNIDPLYYDDVNKIQYPSYFIAIMTTAYPYDLTDGLQPPGTGYFQIAVFDEVGSRYLTSPLPARVNCSQLVTALEAIPGKIIPAGLTRCYHKVITQADPLEQSSLRTKLPDIESNPFSITYQSLYRHYFAGTEYYDLKVVPTPEIAGYTSGAYASNNSLLDKRLTGDLYYLRLLGNPGAFQQPEVNIYLTGKTSQPSLYSEKGQLITKTWTQGQQGLDADFFPEVCPNVRVSVAYSEGETFLFGQFNAMKLFQCLGTADRDDSNNLLIPGGGDYEYDYGSITYPHVIRLERVVTTDNDGGFFAVLYYDPVGTNFDGGIGVRIYDTATLSPVFRLLHPMYSLAGVAEGLQSAIFYVFTTRGILQMISNSSIAEFDFGSKHVYTTNITALTTSLDSADYRSEEAFHTATESASSADISCEAYLTGSSLAASQYNGTVVNTSTWNCLEKEDYFFLIDPYRVLNNPNFLNLYQAKNILQVTPSQVIGYGEDLTGNATMQQANYNHHNLIITNLHTNWQTTVAGGAKFHIYKFTPHPTIQYPVVSQCANRGHCNEFEGLCECFAGYTGDACQVQAAIAT